MKPVSFIGVDPASGDFESALVRTGQQRVSYKVFSIAGSGNEHRTKIIDKVMLLKDMAAAVQPYSEVAQVELQVTASTALILKQALRTLYHQLEVETARNSATQRLMEYWGLGVLTAATIVAEISDITRFPNNNHLASYAGLGRREFKTGSGNIERVQSLYNRRLKNAFITGARNYTLFNPDSHHTGYYRSLKARGMKQTEMYKRVARALVRRFYRDLLMITELEKEETRYKGNPKPASVENQSPKQPHTSKSTTNYTPNKSKIIVSADDHTNSRKEVLIEILS